jgi:hypothetical protein
MAWVVALLQVGSDAQPQPQRGRSCQRVTPLDAVPFPVMSPVAELSDGRGMSGGAIVWHIATRRHPHVPRTALAEWLRQETAAPCC